MRALLKSLILWILADGAVPATTDAAGLDKQAAALK
jgi:hypothetical protein